MKYEKLLIDKLYDNIGSCILIGEDDLLSTKLEKYLKRYMGKSIRLSFGVVDSNTFESLNSYFSFISPKYIILIIDNLTSLNLIQKLQRISNVLNIKIVMIFNSKYKNIENVEYNNTKIYVSDLYGFNEERGELENYFCNEIDNMSFVDEVASKIALAISENKLIDLDSELMNSIYESSVAMRISEKQKYCSLRLLYKGDPNENILGKNVGEFRINLGIRLAENIDKNLKSNIDYIVPVPSSGIFYAVGLSKALNIPFLPALRKLEISERAFEIQNVDMRKSYLSKNMEVNAHLIKGKKILLVDEAIFTGATLKVVCELLKENGALEVHIAIPSPKCYKNCNYLVQPDRKMLLNKINEHAITKYLDVESVTYIELEDYEKMFKFVENICIECFHLPNN